MPTIEIDAQVYRALKTLAVPFEDTPNSVLRRELKLDDSPAFEDEREPARARRAVVGSILPEGEYEAPILAALVEAGGSESAKVVTDRVGELLGARLTPTDRELNRSGEVRWRNRTAFARLHLVQRGLLLRGSRHGLWEISPAGRQALRSPARS